MSVPHHTDSPHPKERTYIKVALVLAVITGIEIVLSYVSIPDGALVGSLVLLSVIKFFAVAAYFMHLKFDNPALRRPFITGIILAIGIYTVVLVNMLLHDTGGPPTG